MSKRGQGAKPPMVGWIGFASLVLIVVGVLAFFEGLIDVVRNHYFAIRAGQLIVFDTATWGWITLGFGVVTVLAGLALFGGAEWARWFAIVMVFMLLLDQLAWLGSSSYPLWTLAIIVLAGTVFYALTVRWGGYGEYVAADPRSDQYR